MRRVLLILPLAVAALLACEDNIYYCPPPKKDGQVPAPDVRRADGPRPDLGPQRCPTCHVAQTAELKSGKHATFAQGCVQCHDNALQHQADPANVAAVVDFSIEVCAACHVAYKDSYLKDDGAKAGKYGGSVKTSKYVDFPKYQHLMGGHAFTLEYNEERAHAYMLKDHIDIKRKQNTVCLQCKSTPVTYYWNELRRGKLLFSKDMAWADVVAKIKTTWPKTIDYGAGCTHCHSPHSADFRLVRKGVVAAILERGTDPYDEGFNVVPKTPTELMAKMNERGSDGKRTTAARRLAGILTCSQCHIEYTCGTGVDKDKGILRDDVPWRKLRDIEAYYTTKYSLQQDWKHTGTGSPGIKPQHPETETYWESKHYKLGATCADCHMVKSGAVTSHWFTSPLKQVDGACKRCHTQDAATLRQQVIAGQDVTWNQAKEVESTLDLVLTAIEAQATNPTVDPTKLAAAKDRFMRGLLWWEWTIVSENSTGQHNTLEVDTNLKKALTEANAAKELLGL